MKPRTVCLSLALALIAAVSASAPLGAQGTGPSRDRLRVVDSTRIQVITMRDGSSLIGRIVVAGADSVEFATGIGRMPIAIRDIREITETDVGSMHSGEYWFPNPNTTRLFFAPTGQMLKKGDGYFSDYQLFFPGVAFGLTDNISIGGGVSLLPFGFDEQFWYLTPKVGFSVGERVHLAAGALVVGSGGETGGVGYGVATLGTGDASATLGLGYGFAGGEIYNKPVAMLGGEKRVSRRIALVTENYLLPDLEGSILYSFGLRFMGERMTVDLALFNVTNSPIIGIPFVDFVFKF